MKVAFLPKASPWWGACVVFLSALWCLQQTQAAPPHLQRRWESPVRLSQIGIRGREPQAGTGKRAQAVFLHSEHSALLLQPPAGPWELLVGVNVSLWGLTGTYSRASVGSVFLYGLEFHCEGAILTFCFYSTP